eukprot:s376_g34.t1
MGFPVAPAPDECHADDAPDAVEPVDGGDGTVVLENNLGAAIEVKLDQEVKVLYPWKSCSFDITRASDKLMKVHCRDDPSIFGTRQVEDSSTLRASESFGSFGVEVADFLQKEQEEVEQEKFLLQERKKKMEEEHEKTRLDKLRGCPISCFFTALFLFPPVLWACQDPQEMALWQALIGCLVMVVSLVGLCLSSLSILFAGLQCSGSRQKKLTYYGSLGCYFLGCLIVSIAIVRFVMAGFWWTVLAAGLPCCCMSTFMCRALSGNSFEETTKDSERIDKQKVAERTIVFEGGVLQGTGKCVCSWPGKYESAWDALVKGSRSGNISAAVVFLPEGSKQFGSHDVIPEEEQLQGRCWCVPLYGEPKPWGCRWWTKWIANIERASREGAEMEVYFFKGLKGKGKVEDFSTAGEEHLRREAIQAKKQDFLQSQLLSHACDDGIKGLSKEPRGDSSSQYSREIQRLFLAWLPEEERHFMEASEGLGNSQKAEAVKMVRGEMGLKNVEIMIPFVRTLEMAKDVNEVLEKNGLKRGEDGLKVNMMAELPSNVFLAEEFLEYFDGFSIGSNDLTQLTLGLDRDSGLVAQYFDERNPAVMKGLETLIKAAKAKGKYVGICGQGPSDHPDLAKWLMEQGIDSVSLNPDSVIPTWQFLAK